MKTPSGPRGFAQTARVAVLVAIAIDAAGCARGPVAATVAPANASGATAGVDGGGAVLAASDALSCAVREGDVVCWGAMAHVEPGAESDADANARLRTVAGVEGARQVATGHGFGCARTAKGEVLCWGAVPGFDASKGAAATTTTSVGIADATQIAAGARYACAVRRGGTVACFSDAVDARVEQVRGLEHARQVAAGGVAARPHACALIDDGRVACWGGNSEGQLGDGAAVDSARPVFVRGVEGAVFVAVGGATSCAGTRLGETWCWGHALDGVERDGNAGWPTAPRDPSGSRPLAARVDALRGARQVALGGAAACAVLDGSVRCVGDAAIAAGARAVTGATWVALGADHACAHDRDGAIVCWGSKAQGATGRAPRTVVWPPELVPSLEGVADVAAERGGSCAAQRDGRIACWGALAHGGETAWGARVAFPRAA